MVSAGTRWRPPKRNDDAAWKRLESGSWHTERHALAPREGSNVPYAFTGPPEPRYRYPWETRKEPSADSLVKFVDGAAEWGEVVHLATHQDQFVRRAVASHPGIPAEMAARLTRDPDPTVAAAATAAPSLPTDLPLRQQLTRHPHPAVRRSLALRDDTPARVLKVLLVDPSHDVRRGAAVHRNARIRDMGHVPMHWLPQDRYVEVVGTTNAPVLASLITTMSASDDFTVRDARTLFSVAQPRVRRPGWKRPTLAGHRR